MFKTLRQSAIVPAHADTAALSVVLRERDPQRKFQARYAVHFRNHDEDFTFSGIYTDSIDTATDVYNERARSIGAVP